MNFQLGDEQNPHQILSPELQLVFEFVSAAVHRQWALQRLQDGWSYGEERNDVLKKTPCLVPYEQLPESEKAYDRNTALCVIDTLQKLGFTIKKEC